MAGVRAAGVGMLYRKRVGANFGNPNSSGAEDGVLPPEIRSGRVDRQVGAGECIPRAGEITAAIDEREPLALGARVDLMERMLPGMESC